jgi:hypothetical protein
MLSCAAREQHIPVLAAKNRQCMAADLALSDSGQQPDHCLSALGRAARVVPPTRGGESAVTRQTEPAPSVVSEVTVGVDPQTAFTAFTVFTDEMDLWLVRGFAQARPTMYS